MSKKNKERREEILKHVRVGIFGCEKDRDFEVKIQEIESFLIKHGGTCTIERKKVTKKDGDTLVIFSANIPSWYAKRHHGFDSVLNNAVYGFGVAFVE